MRFHLEKNNNNKKNNQVQILKNLNNLLNLPSCEKYPSSTLVCELIYKQ